MSFIFRNYQFDASTGELRQRYAFAEGPEFEEVITYPTPVRTLTADEAAALDSAFRLVFLLSGVTYYKARAPHELHCEAFPLDAEQAAFVEKVYRNGLGEFAHKNQLDLSDRINVRSDAAAPAPTPRSLSLPRRTCVPVGGGKDSIVTIETMKRAGEPLILFASGTSVPIANTVQQADLPFIRIIRKLDPALMEMNAQGAYNGHVPITAILSAFTVACAILYGFDMIALSNEHSASEPNLVTDSGVAVNHQYSKSLEFERDFAAVVARTVSPDIRYFSFLRPLSETAIARRFSQLEDYHSIFRSCNTAFKLDEAKRAKHWCCDCPKCRFVFLALAPFLGREKLVGIFGVNLLDDPAQQDGFAELAGLQAFKPFECVGTINENALLLAKLAQLPAWQNDAVIKALAPRLTFDPADFDALFALHPDHAVPPRFLEMLRDGA